MAFLLPHLEILMVRALEKRRVLQGHDGPF